MTKKEEVYSIIDVSAIKEAEIVPSEYGDQESQWSKRIQVTPNDRISIENVLYDVFKPQINKDTWSKLFSMSISGSGNELSKVTTLHSSSLLALLFFSAVSKGNPIKIDKTTYTKVFFEVQNKVFPNASAQDKPSNIDIMLVSDDEKKLLFLESKFTEYIDHGKVEISDKYKNFYTTLFNLSPCTGLTLSGNEIVCKDTRNSQYIGGIKQMISHLIGLATEPLDEDIKKLIDNAESIILEEIVFDWQPKEFEKYERLYEKVFKNLDTEMLQDCLKDSGCDIEKIKRISVGKKLLTYKKLLQENPEYQLSSVIKQFYNFASL